MNSVPTDIVEWMLMAVVLLSAVGWTVLGSMASWIIRGRCLVERKEPERNVPPMPAAAERHRFTAKNSLGRFV